MPLTRSRGKVSPLLICASVKSLLCTNDGQMLEQRFFLTKRQVNYLMLCLQDSGLHVRGPKLQSQEAPAKVAKS